MRKLVGVGLASMLLAVVALSQQSAPQKPEIRTVALKIGGFHCAACGDAVANGLKQLDGVQEVKVDLKTNSATVTYDEAVLPVCQVALAVGNIPHAMGSGMRYSCRLALSLQKGDARKVAAAVAKINGVEKVDREKNTLLITFKRDARVRYAELEKAVRNAGGVLAPVKAPEQHASLTNNRSSCCRQ